MGKVRHTRIEILKRFVSWAFYSNLIATLITVLPTHKTYSIISKSEPLDKLSKRLRPFSSLKPKTYKPPVLHIGWPVNVQKLLNWALEEGFEILTEDIDGRLVRDDEATVDAAVKYFAQRSGAKTFQPYFRFTCHLKERCVIAVGSNYTITSAHDIKSMKADMLNFCRLLHAEQLLARESDLVARWYYDYNLWRSSAPSKLW
jgi:hypothetical protein